MKKSKFTLVPVAVLILIVLYVWFRPAGQQAQEASTATQVAVHAGKVTLSTLRGYVTAYGSVEPAPAGERPAASARVASAVQGIVAQVYVSEGQHVDKGDLLVQLDKRAADVAANFAQETLDRQKSLIQVGGTSQKTLEEAQKQLEAARVQESLLQIVSPLAGMVTRVNVKPGEAIDLTTVLMEVVDMDHLVVSARVPNAELSALAVGQSADVLNDNESTPPVSGSLSYIGAEVDKQTGTSLVRITLPSNSGLLPGQFVSVRIVSVEHRDCLAVPVESVVQNKQGDSVIFMIQNDMAKEMAVTTGLRDGGLIEVEAEGLRAGMPVVTEGAYGLPPETRIILIND